MLPAFLWHISDPRGASGFQDERDFEWQGGNPQRVYARRVAWQDHSERVRTSEKTQCVSVGVSESGIEYLQIQIACEPAKDIFHFTHNAADLLHVASHHYMREARRRRNLMNIVLRPLFEISKR